MDRHIIHLHIPAFSIAVARVSQSGLRSRPVAVAPPQSTRSIIISVSQEARKEGIFKGMPVSRAMRFCPGLTVVPPDPVLVQKASQAIGEVAAGYTPLWEPFRPGHLYLDVTGTSRLWGRAKDTGYRLRREIRDRFRLSGVVGVAGNKMVSSIASQIISSDNILDIAHGREASFMAPLRVRMVPGIGRSRQKILLEELNILRVRDLAALDIGHLRLLFGREAWVIQQRALGIDPTPVYPSHASGPMVSEELILPHDSNDDRKLSALLGSMVERCSYRLRSTSLRPGKAGLLVRYADQVETSRQIKLSCRSLWDVDLLMPIKDLFLKICTRRTGVRFMRVWFQDFSCETSQLSLFHTLEPDQERRTMMIKALDRIRERYGEGAIRYGRAA
ncbi:MAG: DNA polymerase IV [Thermodesulfobacteriota bacterium]|nr:DNA polymerase IV [Thermodesulfobacteriota bacterium]